MGSERAVLLAVCLGLAGCAGPLGTLAPARTLSAGRVAVGATGGLSAPVGALVATERSASPRAAAARALAGPGFGASLGVRAGVAERIEVALGVEPARAMTGVRWAARRPERGLDVSLGARAAGAWGAADGERALAVESLTAAGAGLEVRIGRTWSDFLSVWLATSLDAGSWNLAATWDGQRASDDGAFVSATAALGLRVGFRSLFTGLELGARWLRVSGTLGTSTGLVLVPAFGVSLETR